MPLSARLRRLDMLRPGLLALALYMGLHGSVAVAQETPVPQDSAKMLDTITVTSTKRTTSLQRRR